MLTLHRDEDSGLEFDILTQEWRIELESLPSVYTSAGCHSLLETHSLSFLFRI